MCVHSVYLVTAITCEKDCMLPSLSLFTLADEYQVSAEDGLHRPFDLTWLARLKDDLVEWSNHLSLLKLTQESAILGAWASAHCRRLACKGLGQVGRLLQLRLDLGEVVYGARTLD